MPRLVLPGRPRGVLGSKTIGQLQQALLALKLEIAPRDLARKELGTSTVEAIKAFKRRAHLPEDEKVTAETVAALSAEVEHVFVADSKTRTRRLQKNLQEAGIRVDPEELRRRGFGPHTADALKAYQKKVGLPQDGRVSDALVARLREDALAARSRSKTQVARLQRTLVRALDITSLMVHDRHVDGIGQRLPVDVMELMTGSLMAPSLPTGGVGRKRPGGYQRADNYTRFVLTDNRKSLHFAPIRV